MKRLFFSKHRIQKSETFTEVTAEMTEKSGRCKGECLVYVILSFNLPELSKLKTQFSTSISLD